MPRPESNVRPLHHESDALPLHYRATLVAVVIRRSSSSSNSICNTNSIFVVIVLVVAVLVGWRSTSSMMNWKRTFQKLLYIQEAVIYTSLRLAVCSSAEGKASRYLCVEFVCFLSASRSSLSSDILHWHSVNSFSLSSSCIHQTPAALSHITIIAVYVGNTNRQRDSIPSLSAS